MSRATGEAGQAPLTPEEALQELCKERTAGQPDVVNAIERVLRESSDTRTYDAAAASRMPAPQGV